MNKPGNFTPQEWVTKANIDVMRDAVFCAFCPVLSCGALTLDATIPTACTDGWNIRINPSFAAKLSISELRFVMLHEGMHIAFQHLHVWQHLWKADPTLANIAADMFINLAIVEADANRGFVKMPALGIQPDPQYSGMSVQQIFDHMRANPPQQPQGGKGKPGTGQEQGQDQSGIDAHDWESAGKLDAKEQDARSEAVAQAVRQGAIMQQRAKLGSGSENGVFKELLAARVDWRQALREFITEACGGRDESTWRRPNRRYIANDTYLPSMMSETLGEVVIGFDTSGSCFGSAVMTRFVSEVSALIEATRPSKVHVVYWDTRVVGHQEFTDGQFVVANLKPKGGGGTDGAVLFDYLREKRLSPAAVVQLTDGDVGDWGRSEWPTLWAVTDKRKRAPFGVTLSLE